MLVVVDTNVLGVDPPLDGSGMRRLLDLVEKAELRLVVPELVVVEAANAWARKVHDEERAIEAAERRLMKLGVGDSVGDVTPIAQLREMGEGMVREILREAGADMQGLPDASHKDIVGRALARRRPFDRDGKDGYRDTLLWEAVLSLGGRERVVFVSKDVRAYFDGSPDAGIHEHLASDVEERCKRGGAVELFFDLDAAIDHALQLTQEEDARHAQDAADREAKHALEDRLSDPAVQRSLEERLAETVEWAGLSWADVRPLLPHRETQEIEIEAVEEVARIRVESARKLSREIVAEITAQLLVAIRVHLPEGVAASIDEDDAVVYEGTDEYGERLASALRPVKAHFEAVFDSNYHLERIRLRRLSRTRA